MADAAAPPTRREDSLSLPADPPVVAATRSWPALPWPLVLLWAVMVVGIAAFLGFGSLRIGAGNWIGLRMTVRQIWARFLGYLADQGASPALVMAVVAAAALTLVGSAWALWLAFALRDAPSEATPDDPDGM